MNYGTVMSTNHTPIKTKASVICTNASTILMTFGIHNHAFIV